MKKLLILWIRMMDALIVAAVAPLLLGGLRLWHPRRPPSSHRPRSIFLVPGANIQDIYRKYGTLDVYFQDNPDNYFERCYRFLFCGDNHATYELKPGFIVKDRKAPWDRPWFCYLLRLVVEISLLVRKEGITVLHARDPYLCGLVMLLVSRITSVPFCVSLHADYDEGFRIGGAESSFVLFGSRRLALRLERFVLARAGRVMPIRESLAQYAIRHGAEPSKIRVIPHGIELGAFARGPDPTLKAEIGLAGKRVVSFIGRLSRENYVYDIPEIASQVARERSDVVFLLIGDGREREGIEAQCRAMHLNGVVRLLGFQPRGRIPDLRMISDVNLCLMGGFSLIEACASGMPVIAYDVDWHHELARNDETGYLLPEHDVAGAARAILFLLQDPDRARQMGENARRLAFERHSQERAAGIKVACYEELQREIGPEARSA
ncbi:MAG: glycosyltransferase family 4 protein [Candidatus Tectomicrobia bacterium]|uniref:Glycosyltransferase family 4 protein n=1 Tax=Tectimicrobiota bacterium TaxID=2528274 RepID=A0A932FVG5_UNCTE|nr:glycosyltransferase family 4 protein [Candidatus Tectomicrobia bacterium]